MTVHHLAVRSQQHLLLPIKVQVDDQSTHHGVPLVTLWEEHRPGQPTLLDISEQAHRMSTGRAFLETFERL